MYLLYYWRWDCAAEGRSCAGFFASDWWCDISEFNYILFGFISKGLYSLAVCLRFQGLKAMSILISTKIRVEKNKVSLYYY